MEARAVGPFCFKPAAAADTDCWAVCPEFPNGNSNLAAHEFWNFVSSGCFLDAHIWVPCVTTSETAGNGVFDANLKTHALANLYGCDASVFPHAAAANPTLTIGALALRLADHLAAQP
ncbi:GMC oxidoreductase [Mesorhizobium sp. BE184]|uniref:GMC oxidoreductase n=1 Tax=Mesorhizobium sp. BE184 TaxID=2817714 RepID=UPI002858D991|nr:GMC oxidoreductase [Mesorhizobium sp. BE184]MDR7031950.1 choline dehydrogenase-like flavoprotein [Mesorhizobium sp. BE184]